MDRHVLTLAALLFAAPAAALDLSGLDEPLVTDRPDFTESASTVDRGHVQIESGTTFNRVEEEDSQTFGEVLVRVGLGERWEARLGAGSYARIDGPAGRLSGFEDPSLGVKLRFTEDDPSLLPPGRPMTALILSTTVPAGDDEVTDDAWQPEARLVLAWQLTPRFSLGSNLNYGYPEDPEQGDRFHQLSGSVTTGVALTDRLGAFFEWFGFSEEVVDGPATQYVDAGLTWLIGNDLQLDLRAGVGLNGPDPEYFVGAGASLRW